MFVLQKEHMKVKSENTPNCLCYYFFFWGQVWDFSFQEPKNACV